MLNHTLNCGRSRGPAIKTNRVTMANLALGQMAVTFQVNVAPSRSYIAWYRVPSVVPNSIPNEIQHGSQRLGCPICPTEAPSAISCDGTALTIGNWLAGSGNGYKVRARLLLVVSTDRF